MRRSRVTGERKRSNLELEFSRLWRRRHPDIELTDEHSPVPRRRFRLDFAHLPTKVGIEIQGGTYKAGLYHSSGKGLDTDYEKMNLVQMEGWIVFQLSNKMITSLWIEKIYQMIIARQTGL
jgi:very-short-patch-repair endonuclease